MPWLLTNVTFEEEVEEKDLGNGSFELVVGSRPNRIGMTMIDTDKGKVTEVQYKFLGGTVREREPKMSEIAEAERALNKDAMGEADKLIQAERRASARRQDELLANIHERDEQIKELEHQANMALGIGGQSVGFQGPNAGFPAVAEPTIVSGHVFTGPQQNLLSAALCYYLDFLAEDDQTEGIHLANETHRQITGVLPPEPL